MTNCTIGDSWRNLLKFFVMPSTDRSALKTEILARISTELDQWLEQESSISSGYDYETKLLEVCKRVNRTILEGSVGAQPRGRNAKKKS